MTEIHLYTGLTSTASDSYKAKVWCDENEINYIHLHYGDDSQHDDVFKALNTWFPDKDIADFPFITYKNNDKIELFLGLKEIQKSNLKSIG